MGEYVNAVVGTAANAPSEGPRRQLTLSEAMASGRPDPTLVLQLWTAFMGCQQRKDMQEGREYYRNNSAIDKKKRTIIGEYGNVEEYKEGVVSNSKIKHPDFRTFVRQKISYLMSRPFTIKCEDKGLQTVLEGYFGERVRATVRELAKRTIYSGRAPIEVYYDKQGEMRVRALEPDCVVPYWADAERSSLIAALRRWEEDVLEPDGKIKRVAHFDFYNQDGVWHYVTAQNGNVVVDVARGVDGWDANFYANVPVTDEQGKPVLALDPTTNQLVQPTDVIGKNFARVPILFARYNDEELPLLRFVKSLVDAYDLDVSELDDEIHDVPNSIKVIKGYNGESLGELVHNLRLFRAVSVQADGGVEDVGQAVDSTAAENHLTRLRKDMYSGASCVDTTRVDNLGNQSGVAMRYIYSDLDMDCMELWTDVEEQVLKPLATFFLYDHYAKTGQQFANPQVDFIANTDIAVNETETVTNLKNSVGLISEETIIANHPYVTDASAELERVRKEREEALSLMGGDNLGVLGGKATQPKQVTSRNNGEKGGN